VKSPAISYEEQLAEARREIALRERVYPRWINEGKMSSFRAKRHIEVMRAIADTLAELAKQASPELSFGADRGSDEPPG
jgi:hypothetical protein